MKKNIHLMYAIALLQGMVFYGPVATLYRQAQGVSVFEITLIESISLLLCLLLEIPWGVAADRIGYRRTMVFCCMLYLVSKIVFWQARGFGGFLLERVMLSVIMAGMSGVDTSILYLSCEKGKSQRVFGIYDGLLTVGLLIASVVFSVFIGDNYRLAGGLTVISYALAALCSLGLTEVKAERSGAFCLEECKAVFRQTFRDKYLLLFLAAVAFLSETHQTVTVFLNQLQYVKCGLSAPAMGYIYTAVTLAGLVGVYSARFTGKTGTGRAGLLFFGGACAACLALAFTRRAALSVGSILTLRIAASLFQPFELELQNRQIRTQNRATALSVNAMLTDSIGAGTNLLFGALAQRSLPGAFFFGGGLCLAGLLLFYVWYGRWKQPPAAMPEGAP